MRGNARNDLFFTSNFACAGFAKICIKPVILLPAHPASFAYKFLFQRVPASPGMQ